MKTTVVTTRARPYAKAIFELALETKRLQFWHETLSGLAQIVNADEDDRWLDSPLLNFAQKIDFFSGVIGKDPLVANLIKILVKRKKLSLLPEIAVSYQQLFFQQQGILEVKLVTANSLDQDQEERLLTALKQRYRNEIILQHTVDPGLIGGAVMYIGDKVTDLSMRGMLQSLKRS